MRTMKLARTTGLAGLMLTFAVSAQTTYPFVYQGVLDDNGTPANGVYNIDVSLWDRLAGGNQIGTDVEFNNLPVADGLLVLELDFGPSAFDNSKRWLEISVNGSELSPRQPVAHSPFSITTRGLFVAVNGNVGMGTSSPEAPLHVFGSVLSAGGSTGFTARHPNNSLASVSLNWANDVARIRIGGNGAGASGGFDIQRTGNASLMRILHNGNVGLGTTTPAYRLHAESGSTAVYGNTTSSSSIEAGVFGESTGGGAGVLGWSHGRGPGVSGGSLALTGFSTGIEAHCNSTSGYDFYAAGAGMNYGSSSSRRWKSNIEPIPDPLAKLDQLSGVYFDWDEEHGGHHDIGMIAEEVGAVIPEIVAYEDNGVDAIGMDYSKLAPLLVEAVKELHRQSEELHKQKDAEIAILRAQNESIQARLADMEATPDARSRQRRTPLAASPPGWPAPAITRAARSVSHGPYDVPDSSPEGSNGAVLGSCNAVRDRRCAKRCHFFHALGRGRPPRHGLDRLPAPHGRGTR